MSKEDIIVEIERLVELYNKKPNFGTIDLDMFNEHFDGLLKNMKNMSKEEMTQEDKDYLWLLMPQWVRRVPSNEKLDKTFFATLSREGDLKVHNRVAKLLNQNKDG